MLIKERENAGERYLEREREREREREPETERVRKREPEGEKERERELVLTHYALCYVLCVSGLCSAGHSR